MLRETILTIIMTILPYNIIAGVALIASMLWVQFKKLFKSFMVCDLVIFKNAYPGKNLPSS